MCREATHADPKALCFEMCQQLSSADVFVPRLSLVHMKYMKFHLL